MTTIAKRKVVKSQPRSIRPSIEQERKQISAEGTLKDISVSQIDVSPLNYRRVFLQSDLEEFAEEIKMHGIISPLTIRKMPSGRFELVVGERRLRSAKIAKLKTVPAVIRVLSDDEVREIQLAENMKRVNPHPLYESQQVAILQQGGKSIDEVAVRLQKSKSWVYTRIKLSELIIGIQEIFLAEKITMQDAIDISSLSPETQQEFFDSCCTDWQKEHFRINNLKYLLSRFKYDLKKAPFDTKDKNLVPDAGACSRCPFNSATLKSLFPEYAKEAVCMHKACYKNKCLAHAETMIRNAFSEHQPTAILYQGSISEESRIIIDSLPEANALPEYGYGDVTVYIAPRLPEKEDFKDYSNVDDDDDSAAPIDQEEYNEAMQEYEINLAEYNSALIAEATLKGLCISHDSVRIVFFNPERKKEFPGKVTAKEVQEAIKAGTVTPELLEQEKERINDREKRAKEIDLDKIQAEVHKQFAEQSAKAAFKQKPSAADLAAARMVIYQSLDYSTIGQVKANLFGQRNISIDTSRELLDALSKLTEQQYCYLVRMAVIGKSESKYPGHLSSIALYDMAKASGTDVAWIEQKQADKAKDREEKLVLRIKELEIKIKRLQKKQ